YIWKPNDRESRASRIADVVVQFIGFCTPMILTAGYFYFYGGLDQFIRYNFLFFIGAKGDSPFGPIVQFTYMRPFVTLFGIVGLINSLVAIFQKSLSKSGDFIVAPTTLSLVAGLFLIPFPYYQYYIAFLPTLAVIAAGSFFTFVE